MTRSLSSCRERGRRCALAPLEEIKLSLEDGIGTLSLNRPDFHNAVSEKMWLALPAALAQLEEAGARVVVVTGSGRSFASGADLTELASLDNEASVSRYWNAIAGALKALRELPLPTIAMVDGACIGGGCLIAIACDLRYASSSATFAIPVARLGIVLDDENIGRLVSLVGSAAAKELIFLGATVMSARAEAIGLVTAVVGCESLAAVVRNTAQQIAANAPGSLRQAKAAIHRVSGEPAPNPAAVPRQVIESYLGEEFRRRIAAALKKGS